MKLKYGYIAKKGCSLDVDIDFKSVRSAVINAPIDYDIEIFSYSIDYEDIIHKSYLNGCVPWGICNFEYKRKAKK